MAVNKGGHPVTLNPDDIADKLEQYIAVTDMPYIERFALEYPISIESLRRLRESNKRLDGALKKALTKQELYLNEMASHNKINPTFAIFKLKQPQFGYSDRPVDNATHEIVIKLDTSGK